MSADRLAVGKYLGAFGVTFAGDRPDFFQQRHVAVGFDVASNARVAIPVPGAAEVAALLDDAERLDVALDQICRGQQPGKTAADDHHVDGFDTRFPMGVRLHVWIIGEIGEIAFGSDILPAGGIG